MKEKGSVSNRVSNVDTINWAKPLKNILLDLKEKWERNGIELDEN